MNNIKSRFSIKDLENLSGIKAHTIRIWEKRYNLFKPNRTDTNIRYYSLESLQKLLNITFRSTNGYKISKIAELSPEEISNTVKTLSTTEHSDNYTLNMLKLSMLNFDKALFQNVYKSLALNTAFDEIFYDVFIPLLNEIGFLWQTKTITPAQEHFISELIVQKILLQTEKYQYEKPKKDDTVYVLFLPENEIHALGLHFINYQLNKLGHQTIYLGPSVPIDSLKDVLKHYNKITFVSYFTVKPESNIINDYLNTFKNTLLQNGKHKLWVLGKMVEFANKDLLKEQIRYFTTIKNLVKEL